MVGLEGGKGRSDKGGREDNGKEKGKEDDEERG